MTEYEIRSKIRRNEDMVDSYQSQIRELEEQMEDLEYLRSKFSTLQTNFGNKQDVRKRGLSGVFAKTAQIKIASRYYSGMNDLLNGTEFMNAYNGLSDAKDTIVRELDKIFTQREDLTRELNYRKQRITYWETELRKLQYR
ncbi:hypothetical protein [Roseburia sp. 499]|uniref:hypothetical protein n=1 Tax=Roseburia sp. 499 TaxID=1261634 RepID=UPI00095142D4|nr:hypothetical protein [Roseburia sp. 499]WVK70913.1 hypothetical protein BIV20_05105 [Roseburia sp. 499]